MEVAGSHEVPGFLIHTMDLINYSYAHVVLFNFPCELGSQLCYVLFANGAGDVEYFFIVYFSKF